MLNHLFVPAAKHARKPQRKLIGTMLGTAALAGLFGMIWHAVNSGTVDERVERLRVEAEQLQREHDDLAAQLASAGPDDAPAIERRLADLVAEIERLHAEAQDWLTP